MTISISLKNSVALSYLYYYEIFDFQNKARPPVKDSTSHAISETYEQTTLILPDGLLCRECDTPLESDKHFL